MQTLLGFPVSGAKQERLPWLDNDVGQRSRLSRRMLIAQTARRRRGLRDGCKPGRDWVYRYNAGGPIACRTARRQGDAERRAEGGMASIVAPGPDPRATAWCVGGRIDLKHMIRIHAGVHVWQTAVPNLAFRRLSVHILNRIRAQARSKKNFAQLVRLKPVGNLVPDEARTKPALFMGQARPPACVSVIPLQDGHEPSLPPTADGSKPPRRR